MVRKIKKEIIEWLVMIGVILVLFTTGLHKELAGQLQRLILFTNIMTPDLMAENEVKIAKYDFKIRDIDGQVLDFSNFKGKTIFMNFWATWCPPCIAEMPDIQDLHDKVKTDIVFVMISRDEDFEKAKAFVTKKEYTLPIYQMASSLPKVYHSQSIPTTFVISPDGKVVSKTTGMAKYDTNKFREFLLSF